MTDEKELRETAERYFREFFVSQGYGSIIDVIEKILRRDREEREKCIECNGTGTKTYGDTACGRGIGGQMITGAACDKCIGTGRIPHIAAKLERLRECAKEWNISILLHKTHGYGVSYYSNKNERWESSRWHNRLPEAIDAALREVEKK